MTTPDLGQDQPRQVGPASGAGPGPASSLTEREVEVLRVAATGLTYRAVAYRLGISEQTVKNHMASAYMTLGVGSLIEALNVLGWVSSDETSQTYAHPVQWWVRT